MIRNGRPWSASPPCCSTSGARSAGTSRSATRRSAARRRSRAGCRSTGCWCAGSISRTQRARDRRRGARPRSTARSAATRSRQLAAGAGRVPSAARAGRARLARQPAEAPAGPAARATSTATSSSRRSLPRASEPTGVLLLVARPPSALRARARGGRAGAGSSRSRWRSRTTAASRELDTLRRGRRGRSPVAARAPRAARTCRRTSSAPRRGCARRWSASSWSRRPTSRCCSLGETGSGKEVAARAIHTRSPRAARPVPARELRRDPGRADRLGAVRPRARQLHRRRARSGRAGSSAPTAERSSSTRSASCRSPRRCACSRILQDGSFERVGGTRPLHADVRIVAATHRDLRRDGRRSGRFREDLWYRLARLRDPPAAAARARRRTSRALATHFALRAATRFGLPALVPTRDDVSLLAGYAWPGNIRELGAVMDARGAARAGAARSRSRRRSARPRAPDGPRVRADAEPAARRLRRSRSSPALDAADGAPHRVRARAHVRPDRGTVRRRARAAGEPAARAHAQARRRLAPLRARRLDPKWARRAAIRLGSIAGARSGGCRLTIPIDQAEAPSSSAPPPKAAPNRPSDAPTIAPSRPRDGASALGITAPLGRRRACRTRAVPTRRARSRATRVGVARGRRGVPGARNARSAAGDHGARPSAAGGARGRDRARAGARPARALALDHALTVARSRPTCAQSAGSREASTYGSAAGDGSAERSRLFREICGARPRRRALRPRERWHRVQHRRSCDSRRPPAAGFLRRLPRLSERSTRVWAGRAPRGRSRRSARMESPAE